MGLPIIYLIPGIAGSFLRRKRRILPDEYVWLPAPGIFGLNSRSLALASDGLNSALGAGEIIYPAGILRSYYGPLYERLVAMGYPVKMWAYDWRISVSHNALALANDVASLLPGQGAVFVAHSMGGLIARMAWQRLTDAEMLDRVTRVVTLGTPIRGSWEAPRVAAHANESWLPIFRLLSLATRGYTFSNGMKLIDWLTSTWPAFHELIPLAGAETGFGPVPADVANVEHYRPLNGSLTQGFLDDGQRLLTSAQAVSIDPFRWVIVRGTGVHTAQTIREGGKLSDPGDYLWNDQGDGVVPTWSAKDSRAAGYVFKGVGHGPLCTDPAVLGLMDVMLTGDTPARDVVIT